MQKYDDKRTLALSYLDKLFKFKSIKLESAAQLNMFVEQFSASVAALKNLNLDQLDDFIILAIALSKLDPETVKLFEMSVKADAIPTFQQLDKFVKEQAKLLGRMPKSSVKIDNPQTSLQSNKFSQKTNSNLTHSFVIENPKHLSCCACNKAQHPLFNCEAFLNLSPLQRFDLVKKHGFCLNCFNPNHIVTACKSKHHCTHCSSRHNTLLHFREKQSVTQTEPGTSNHQHKGPATTRYSTLCSATNECTPNPSNQTVLLHSESFHFRSEWQTAPCAYALRFW